MMFSHRKLEFCSRWEEGTAIIMAILILLILSVIGVYAVSTSTVETKITGLERGFQEAFYTADSGEPIGIYITNLILHYDYQLPGQLGSPWSNVIKDQNLLGVGGELYTITRDPDQPEVGSADISSAGFSSALGLPAHVLLLIDIDRLDTRHCPGSGVEFASGYEPIGHGGGGDISVLYTIDSVGRYGLRGAESRITVGYLFVPGMAGGQ